jgi:hypothetical protein
MIKKYRKTNTVLNDEDSIKSQTSKLIVTFLRIKLWEDESIIDNEFPEEVKKPVKVGFGK